MTRVDTLGEMALVARLRAVLDRPSPRLEVQNGDDAAVWVPRGRVVACVDSIVEGVDWLPGKTPPRAIGHRAAAVNLSDLAAMGATPGALLLALELPPDADADAVVEAAAGLASLAADHGAVVIGGDVGVSPGPARWTVTALGDLEGPALRRDAGRSGDGVWLFGSVGRAAIGLDVLRTDAGCQPSGGLCGCVDAHRWPAPLVSSGIALQRLGLRLAAIDVSDGLGLDASRLAAASGLDLDLTLPRPAWLDRETEEFCTRRGWDWRDACAAGGDDYALLVLAPPGLDLVAAMASDSLPIPQRIGSACNGEGRVRLSVAGREVAIDGWRHGGSLKS